MKRTVDGAEQNNDVPPVQHRASHSFAAKTPKDDNHTMNQFNIIAWNYGCSMS